MLRFLLGFTLAALMGFSAAAQEFDEIIVTGSRIAEDLPGQILIVPGDNLLLEVAVESDDRDGITRYREITETIQSMLAAAEEDDTIEISFVDGNIVRPLSPALFEEAVRGGSRPDTSIAFLQVKTPIPDNVPDAFALATELQSFIDTIEEKGRVTVEATDEVTVSVVNPNQYRPRVLGLITREIRAVTEAMGPNYRATLTGIHGELKSLRAGDLSLGFYLPYTYEIIPDTIHKIERHVDEDY
jgi:hypothetical protein